MRRRKDEEIRRLLSAAKSMCDLSELDGVRKKISEAIAKLEELKESRSKKISKKTEGSKRLSDPLSAIRAIEAEIGMEMKKFTKNDDTLMND